MWICWSTISCSIGTSMENSYRSSVAWSDLLWLLKCKQMVRDQHFLQQYAEACCSVVRMYRWTMSSDYMRRHYLYTVAAMHWAATGWVVWICRQSGEHFTDNTSVELAGWIVIAGVCFGLWFPNYMHCKFFSTCSLLVSNLQPHSHRGCLFRWYVLAHSLFYVLSLWKFLLKFCYIPQLNLSVKWIHMILKKPKNFPLRVYNLNQRKKL
jgi:hypothetical protein